MEAGMKVEVEEAMELGDQLHKRFKHDPSLLAAMESGTEPVTESVMEYVTEPALGAVTEPALGAVTEPALGAITEPVTESAMESVTEPMEAVKDSAMESVTKPPETIWKSIRDRVLRSSDLPLTSDEGYDVEYIFYPYWANSDRLLIKISQTGLDLNEVDREFAKLVPPPPPEEKANLVLVICYFDNHPEKGYTFAWVRDFSSLYNNGNARNEDDLSDDDPDDPDEAEVDDPDKAEVDKVDDDDDNDDDDNDDDDDDDDEEEEEEEEEEEDEDEDGDEDDDGDDFLYAIKSNRDPFDREDDDADADRFGFRRNYERTLAARVRRAMSKRTECRYVFGSD
ncbi:hypothetical protein SO802_017142 [Lithocarpus litseifolius]|uniref:Uncharacterized protein n=1 Tax=Lithocarpus litseifolius TaxID=425828 RepID=A0AAW2D298_9ROSI